MIINGICVGAATLRPYGYAAVNYTGTTAPCPYEFPAINCPGAASLRPYG